MINDIYRSILKTLILEMAVQEFSAPDGPSAKLLKLSNQFGHGLTVEQVTEPPLIEHPGNQSTRGKPGQKVYDSWPMSKWREILLSFMRDNGGAIILQEWAKDHYKPEEHNGLSYGFSRIHAAITDMNLRLGLVRLVNKGRYELTEKGWDLVRQQQPETVTIEDIPALEAGANGDYAPNLTVGDHLLEWMRREGDFATKKYAPAFEAYFHKSATAKNGTIFGALRLLQDRGLAKKLGLGKYKLTPKARSAAA